VILACKNTPDDSTSSAGLAKGRGKMDKKQEEDKVFGVAKDLWDKRLHGNVKDSMFYI
jgi:eukaryotic translation initiation factor 2C